MFMTVKHKSHTQKEDIEEESDDMIHWLNKYVEREEKETQKEKATINTKKNEKRMKLDSKQSDEDFQDCLPYEAFQSTKVTSVTDDEACTSHKTKEKHYSEEKSDLKIKEQEIALEDVKSGIKRNAEVLDVEASKRQKVKNKEALENNAQIGNFNGYSCESYKPTKKLNEEIIAKSIFINEFKSEATKYLVYRKSNGECNIYRAIKDQEYKINSARKTLQQADEILKSATESKTGKSPQEKKLIDVHTVQRITHLEENLQRKLENIDNEQIKKLTNVIKEKNKRIDFKSILANRTYNSNYMETSKKEKKLWKEIFVTEKIKLKTLPQFSSERIFHPDEKRRQEERKAKLNFKKHQSTTQSYFANYKKKEEVTEYTGATLPVLGTENQAIKKQQKRNPVSECIDLDDSVPEIDQNDDPFKVKADPFYPNYQKVPATLQQIQNSETSKDNEEKFEVLGHQVNSAYRYLRYIRHPEHMFKNWKI